MGTEDGSRGRDGSELIVCYSHLRWDFVTQRPQHLLTRAARDRRVLFVEEPVHEDGVEPHLSITPRDAPFGGEIRVAVPVLPRGISTDAEIAEQRRLVDATLNADPASFVLSWYYAPMALRFAEGLRSDLVLYDCMDELSAFRGAPPELTACESRLYEIADLVLTGGMSLYEAKRTRHPHVHAVPSSIDAAHFGRARSASERGVAESDDQASIPHPRVGFFGVVDERMDVDLVGRLAALRPDLHFVMIGPVVKIDPASLPQTPNLHWIGSKPYSALPDYLAGWDLGFMPFARNEATRFISPTKTPEFLAAGVPVVSTSIRDVVSPYGELGLVEIADEPEAMSRALDALTAMNRGEWLARVDARLAQDSWDKSFARVEGFIEDAKRRRAARRPELASASSFPASPSSGGDGKPLASPASASRPTLEIAHV